MPTHRSPCQRTDHHAKTMEQYKTMMQTLDSKMINIDNKKHKIALTSQTYYGNPLHRVYIISII
jgi:hypothetical protein